MINTMIEIFGRPYAIRCEESELEFLEHAAHYVTSKMGDTKAAGQPTNFEKIAVIAALNIASEYLQLAQQKNVLVNKLNQRINHLHDEIDAAINKVMQVEFVYSKE